jgi:hypothetical protein
MATWTAATAVASGGLITGSYMSNTANAINFLGAADATYGKDLALIFSDANQTGLTANAYTALTFPKEDFDVASGHSTTTNTSRYTAAASGKYRIAGAVYMAAGGTNASQSLKFRLYINGTGQTAYTYDTPNKTATNPGHYDLPTFFISLTAGQYVELFVSPEWTAATGSATFRSWLAIEWIGAS